MRWINLCSCWIQQIILWSKAVIRIWTSKREMDQRLNSEGQIWKNNGKNLNYNRESIWNWMQWRILNAKSQLCQHYNLHLGTGLHGSNTGGNNILEGRINKRRWSDAWAKSQQQIMTRLFSGMSWFDFICNIIWKVCHQIAYWDFFYNNYCLSFNNFYCKLSPFQRLGCILGIIFKFLSQIMFDILDFHKSVGKLNFILLIADWDHICIEFSQFFCKLSPIQRLLYNLGFNSVRIFRKISHGSKGMDLILIVRFFGCGLVVWDLFCNIFCLCLNKLFYKIGPKHINYGNIFWKQLHGIDGLIYKELLDFFVQNSKKGFDGYSSGSKKSYVINKVHSTTLNLFFLTLYI